MNKITLFMNRRNRNSVFLKYVSNDKIHDVINVNFLNLDL